MVNITETDWAYLAGMIDGEGCLALFRHFQKKVTVTSSRGYELEPRMSIANMNQKNMEDIKQFLQLGNITKVVSHKDDEEGTPRIIYDLRFGPNNQRIILPKVLPYLRQKKARAEIILELLKLRDEKKLSKQTKESKAILEIKYLELEKRMCESEIIEKPWILTAKSRRGRRERLNISMPKRIQNIEDQIQKLNGGISCSGITA